MPDPSGIIVTPRDAEPPDDSPSSSTAPRVRLQDAFRLVLIVAGLCVIAGALRAASAVLAPIVAALFVSLVALAPLPWLAKRLPRWAAAGVVATVGLGALAVLGALLPDWIAELAAALSAHGDRLDGLVDALREQAERYGIAQASAPVVSGGWVVSASQLVFRLVTGALAAVLFTGFILAESHGFKRKLVACFGGRRPERLDLARRVSSRLASYFRVKTVASAATGLIAGTACAVVGVAAPALWGVLAFALNFAPTIGSIVAAVPPVIIAGITLGWESAAVLGAIYLLTNGLIGGVLEPKVLGERMGLSPLVVILSLVFWGWVWGPIGLLLAVPMTMVARIVLEQTEGLRPVAVLLGSGRDAHSGTEEDDPSVLDRAA